MRCRPLSYLRYAALAVTCALVPVAWAQGMTPPQREALNAAQTWLARVDKQQYADAWTAAAEPFRTSVTRQAFVEGAPKLRRGLGKVTARSGDKLAYVGAPPDPSDPSGAVKPGMKIAIHFTTKFAGDKTATEEVTMLLESDGVWRPVGYYLQ
ncbi:MAG: DUF4019 domain-containing protein [Burkholderiales bacterium]|nr:DUF4019 domain-containing protein [Burkholderiales bacterium]